MPTPAVGGERLPVVVARSVSKTFTVPEEQVHTLKERALHPRRRIRRNSYKALDNVSVAVQPGEFFGIAGRNGSGKSTFLKCMAGIYKAEGDIWVRGRLSTFIELGVGFNPDLAARDNVVMNGIMLGLTPREARKRYESVIEFAELQEFKELKLKNYSSGMHVRLAFSVAIQVDADILMIDEVLAVGDAAFQQKCFDVFNDLRDRGRTIIFVTHDMGAMQRFCHRALLLERGRPGAPGRAPRGRRPLPGAQLRARGAGGGRRRRSHGRRPGARGRGVARGGRRRASVIGRAASARHPQGAGRVHRGRHRSGGRRPDLQRRAPRWCSSPPPRSRTSAPATSAPARRCVVSFAFDNVLAPGRYAPVFQLTHRGSGLGRDRPVRGQLLVRRHRRRRARRSHRPARAVRRSAAYRRGHVGGTRT